MTHQDDPEDDAELMALVDEVLREQIADPTDAEIEAILADPVFAPIAARAVQPYDKALTEKGRAGALRTLAVVFLTDPRAASLLAAVRAGATGDGSRTTLAASAEEPDAARRSKP